MKVNLPVTGVAREVNPTRPIVSETDLKGALTYANDAFVEISGFTREELIGKNHNIVRHPDMPPVAFADLWDTIKAGKPWRGIVKNRCKNGDHYWVEAYATPVYKNGTICGYKSVRSKPSANDVAACEKLYKEIREGRASLPSSRPSWLKRLSLQTRVNIAVWSLVSILPINLILDHLLGMPSIDWILMGLSVAIAGVAAWSLNRSISKPLGAALATLEQISEGNLNQPLSTDREDEFGKLSIAIESMRIHLRAMIADVFWASEQTKQNADKLGQSMQQLMTNFELQSDRVSQVSAAMEQMNASIAEVSTNTETEAGIVSQTRHLVEEGNSKMELSLQATQRVETAVVSSGETINHLNTAIQKIGAITLTIKEIAEQTNLLALNAAIEAARAGEQGRGFAVVADEVRKLAERTTNSTGDITNMVEKIRATTNTAVSGMDAAVNEVKRGMEFIHASGDSLKQILDAANQVTEMTQSTAHTFKEQAIATGEVTGNMEKISSMAEHNHRSLEVVGEGIEQLSHTANELALLVKRFENSMHA